MGVIGKDFKYKIVKNFLSKDEISLLAVYMEIKHRLNTTKFDFVQSDNADTKFYGDPLTDTLLLKKQKLVESETNKKILPTYSYWRCYTKNADLKPHKDRPSCEISVTVNISGKGENWPIYMEDTPMYLEKGDAALYLGCEITHSRKKFKGDHQFQTFLHYVDANGKYVNHYMDKRNFWGMDPSL